MNVIFTVIIIASTAVISFISPSGVLTTFSSAANKALSLAATLIVVYVVWLGFSEVINQSGLSVKISNKLKPLIKRLFKTDNDVAINEISLNLSANLLGLGGVATPYGINAMSILDADGNVFAKNMLFVITATSIQIFPTSVMAIMTEYGSVAPYEIFLPTLLTTAASTGVGILLTFTFK